MTRQPNETTEPGDSSRSGEADDLANGARSERERALAAAARAFELGNYAEVRRLTPPLFATAEDPATAHAARALFERTRPDPLVSYLLALGLALLVAVTIFAYAAEVP